MADPEARDRLAIQATRQALRRDVRRARLAVPGGLAIAGGGVAIVALIAWAPDTWAPGGQFSAMVLGAVGVLAAVSGVAIAARAVLRAMIGRRQLRELDRRALPAARVVRR